MRSSTFLRSIKLRDDLADPVRLAHYRPTRKSAAVVDAVVKPGGASMVVAAYGSGKSLAAGIGALLVQNDADARRVLRPIIASLSSVDQPLADQAASRLGAKVTGTVIALSGFIDDLAKEISEQTGITEKFRSLDKLLAAVSRLQGCDHVAVVWDEFGRHLEGLVDHGRSRELDHVQTLAEWAVRTAKPTASLTLLMHQNLLAYAGRLNQSTRGEWRKVEGRFTPIRFLEDSFEIFQLLADVITEDGDDVPMPYAAAGIATDILEAGWFGGERDTRRVTDVVEMAWPVTAGALHALPALVARVGQNERSLFGFLAARQAKQVIGFEEVYAAFSDAMRSDVGIGGAYRRWIETESARARAQDDVERETLAAACILQLGRDGERRRLRRSALELAVRCRGTAPDVVAAAVDALIARSLLLWRTRNDDVSVWHGTDVDVSGRVREERERRSETFDLPDFVRSRLVAPFVRPVAHNVRLGVARHLKGLYLTARELASNKDELPLEAIPADDEDGRVVYILAESVEELDAARKVVLGPTARNKRTVFAVPDEPCEFREAALEILALEALRADTAFVSADPHIASELDELMTVARAYLDALLRRLVDPRPHGTTWYHDGQPLDATPDKPVSVVASLLMDGWFKHTPRIPNDGILRDRISRQMRTARVRVMRNTLERVGRPHLGYDPADRSAEASIFRTILEKTSLYRTEGDTGRFAEPEELSDQALTLVWRKLADFFAVHDGKPKAIADLVGRLAGEPHGLPKGLIPILATAGYVKFARAVALTRDGQYLPDILGFDIERIFEDPAPFAVMVLDQGQATATYLEEVAYIFSHRRPTPGTELVRFAIDAVLLWRSSVPDAARRTLRVSEGAREMVRLTASITDPLDLLLRDFVALAGQPGLDEAGRAKVISTLERLRNEVDGLVEGYTAEAVAALSDTLTLAGGLFDPVDDVRQWVECFDVDALLGRSDLRVTDKAILRTARETSNGRFSPQSLARALSSVLLQKGLDQWGDATVDQFRATLREAKARIEDAALDAHHPPASLRPVVEARIRSLEGLLKRMPEPKQSVVEFPRKARTP